MYEGKDDLEAGCGCLILLVVVPSALTALLLWLRAVLTLFGG